MENIKIGVEVKKGYMGCNAYIGRNYKGYMRYSEINKIVKSEFKKRFKDVKVSCKGNSFSGGQECNGTIMMKLNEIVRPYDEFIKRVEETNYYPKMSGWYIVGKEAVWGEKLSYEERIKATYEGYVSRLNNRVRINGVDELDKAILTEKAVESVEYLNDLYDSFNYDECNGMVDYFDVMFYKSVEIKVVEEL